MKVTVNLPDEAVESLKNIARRDRVTMTEALRRSISLQVFVDEQQDAGGKILIEDSDKNLQQLLIR